MSARATEIANEIVTMATNMSPEHGEVAPRACGEWCIDPHDGFCRVERARIFGAPLIAAYGAAEYRRGVEAAIETVGIHIILGVGPEMIRREIIAALRRAARGKG